MAQDERPGDRLVYLLFTHFGRCELLYSVAASSAASSGVKRRINSRVHSRSGMAAAGMFVTVPQLLRGLGFPLAIGRRYAAGLGA
jgi:hypothetical protein